MKWLVLLGALGLAWGQLTEEQGRQWAENFNQQAEAMYPQSIGASWNYQSNITDHNQRVSLDWASRRSAFDNAAARNASQFPWRSFQDAQLKRQFSKITDIGTAALTPAKLNEFNQVVADMQRKYSTGRVCNKPGDSSGKCYPLEPDLTGIMANSRDWNELVWAWEGWRNETGRKMPDDYVKYVQLSNEAATINGYQDGGEYWRSWYEMNRGEFRQLCEQMWNTVKPLYEQLHSYVLRKLKNFYSSRASEFPSSGHIPAHLLGNMWAQSWAGIESIVRPFPNKPSIDVTPEMKRQNWNATYMFQVSEEFFTSLGLIEMPPLFWQNTMFVKPTDRQVVCHASAWDFYDRKDFRIKQCTEVNMNYLVITHHEMGHVEYFLQYMNHPVKFRAGANPGFHEAIGDVLALAVTTPEHLNKIGLLPTVSNDTETDLNFLMTQSLGKLSFLPFGYLIDMFRWDVFNGQTTKAQFNEKWWEARCKYQGLSPPTGRPRSDFDAGAKYHVPANVPYVRYFISHVLQFQFYKAMCNAAGHTGPLHRCDFYQSKEAGKLLGDTLKMGSSRPWPEALEKITGNRTMSAEPMVEYFQPLLTWLEEQNRGHQVGWQDDCPAGSLTP